jgi:serine protease Do
MSSFVLGAALTAGAAWFVPNAVHAVAAAPGAAADSPKELTSYRDIVKKALPAVVSIESRTKVTIKTRETPRRKPTPDDNAQNPDDLFKNFPNPFDDNGADQGPDDGVLGFGSGFLVDPKGVVMTAAHVVDGADEVTVELNDGRKFVSRDIKADDKTDLAIIRIQAKDALPYLEFGDSDAMEIGDRVLAVGEPFGLAGTVTSGIICAKGGNLGMNMYDDFLRTDAAINPGNSGGPLINMQGQVIGINSAIKSKSGGFQGVGLAIASNLAKNIKEALVKDGVVHRGYLGIGLDDLESDDLATHLGLKDAHGVIVTRIVKDSPAIAAGLKPGDVVTSLGGKAIKDSSSLKGVVAVLPKGKPVEVAVVRDGKPQTLSVTIEEQPPDFGQQRVVRPRLPEEFKNTVALDKIGAEATDLTAELDEGLGYEETAKGALLTDVKRNGAASLAGLGRGVAVTKVEDQPVTSADELKDKLASAALDKGIMLQVRTPQGGVTYVLLKNGEQ